MGEEGGGVLRKAAGVAPRPIEPQGTTRDVVTSPDLFPQGGRHGNASAAHQNPSPFPLHRPIMVKPGWHRSPSSPVTKMGLRGPHGGEKIPPQTPPFFKIEVLDPCKFGLQQVISSRSQASVPWVDAACPLHTRRGSKTALMRRQSYPQVGKLGPFFSS